jgi:hypothetical protein
MRPISLRGIRAQRKKSPPWRGGRGRERRGFIDGITAKGQQKGHIRTKAKHLYIYGER